MAWFKTKHDRRASDSNDNLKKLRELTEVFADHSEIISGVYTALLDSNDIIWS